MEKVEFKVAVEIWGCGSKWYEKSLGQGRAQTFKSEVAVSFLHFGFIL